MFEGFLSRIERGSASRIIRKSGVFDSRWYLMQYPDVSESGIDPLDHYISSGKLEKRRPSPLFDPEYYERQFPELGPNAVNPLCHYLVYGEAAGARPNPWFDPGHVRDRLARSAEFCSVLGAYRAAGATAVSVGTAFDPANYFAQFPDVRQLNMNPLEHFLTGDLQDTPLTVPYPAAGAASIALKASTHDGLKYLGRREGQTFWEVDSDGPGFRLTDMSRRPFEPGYYELSVEMSAQAPALRSLEIRSSCLDTDGEQWFSPLRFVDAGRGVLRARFGLREPAPELRLATSGTELPKQVLGIGHILLKRTGRLEYYGSQILAAPPDSGGWLAAVATTAMTTLQHGVGEAAIRLRKGSEPQRRPIVRRQAPPPPVAQIQIREEQLALPPIRVPEIITRPVDYLVERATDIDAGDDILLFVAYAPEGGLNNLQAEMVSMYRQAGYKVIVIINAGRLDERVDPGCSDADGLIIRENIGWDFGAWKHACDLISGLDRAKSVSLTNDSIFPVRGAGGLRDLRNGVRDNAAQIVFCTQNMEVTSHLQSYFFSFKSAALKSGALDIVRSIPYYADKDDVIYNIEIKLSSQFRQLGLEAGHLFELGAATESGKNPTVHYWQELIQDGFPFFKLQLLTAGIIQADDPDMGRVLGERTRDRLLQHVAERAAPSRGPLPGGSFRSQSAFGHDSRYNEYGAQNAYNPAPRLIRPVIVPFADIEESQVRIPGILGVLHCFYLDVAEEILAELAALGIPMRLLLTTDTPEKVAALDHMLRDKGLTGAARLTQNRGRDVAPFLIELGADAGTEEIVFHLHSKKSKHDDRYAGWGKFLRRNLIGDRARVLSILALLDDPCMGLVYSEHFLEVAGLRNWGFDFAATQSLLERMGCRINADTLLEFPTSTMFWTRRAAIQPLLDLELDYQDFEPEDGQVDGTLAHSIERSLLYVCEHAGFRFTKVISSDADETYLQDATMTKTRSIPHLVQKGSARLLGNEGEGGSFYQHVGEIYRVGFAPSASRRKRMNFIIPTMKPEKIYGGISTAVNVFRDLLKALPADIDVRVLVVSDDVNRESCAELSARLDRVCTRVRPSHDAECGLTIVDLATNRFEPLSLREDDVVFATAWWTADLAYRMADSQKLAFGRAKPVVYLIQDFEPGFYNWSNHYALAEATYWQGEDTIALINSEELFAFMTSRYEFSAAMCIPYERNARLSERIQEVPNERIIICYGRPGTARNCFHIIVEGLRRWQAAQPELAKSFRIVFAGEPFDVSLLGDLQYAEVAGKLSLDEYADLLSRSAIGISLMVSPHPSYPPLEMASAGCWTITNGFEGKDLTARSPNIVSLNQLNPAALSRQLERIAGDVDEGRFGVPGPVGPLAIEGDLADMKILASRL